MICDNTEDLSESAFAERPQEVEWLINSGASKHVTSNKQILQEYQ